MTLENLVSWLQQNPAPVGDLSTRQPWLKKFDAETKLRSGVVAAFNALFRPTIADGPDPAFMAVHLRMKILAKRGAISRVTLPPHTYVEGRSLTPDLSRELWLEGGWSGWVCAKFGGDRKVRVYEGDVVVGMRSETSSENASDVGIISAYPWCPDAARLRSYLKRVHINATIDARRRGEAKERRDRRYAVAMRAGISPGTTKKSVKASPMPLATKEKRDVVDDVLLSVGGEEGDLLKKLTDIKGKTPGERSHLKRLRRRLAGRVVAGLELPPGIGDQPDLVASKSRLEDVFPPEIRSLIERAMRGETLTRNEREVISPKTAELEAEGKSSRLKFLALAARFAQGGK